MAKNFPYFKFIVTEWMTGDIVYEPFNVQGLFINVCALYWQRDGILMIEDINKRFKNPPELAELTDRFFPVKDGFISIAFLDEQLTEANHISKINSLNGSLGGRPKGHKILEKKPTANRPQSEPKAKKSKEEKEEELNKNKNKTKECVRENVFLHRTEMETLQRSYSVEDINWMLDKLSSYKLSSGRIYRSDYGAITNWVVDRLKEEKLKEKNSANKENGTETKYSRTVAAATELAAKRGYTQQPNGD